MNVFLGSEDTHSIPELFVFVNVHAYVCVYKLQ